MIQKKKSKRKITEPKISKKYSMLQAGSNDMSFGFKGEVLSQEKRSYSITRYHE